MNIKPSLHINQFSRLLSIWLDAMELIIAGLIEPMLRIKKDHKPEDQQPSPLRHPYNTNVTIAPSWIDAAHTDHGEGYWRFEYEVPKFTTDPALARRLHAALLAKGILADVLEGIKSNASDELKPRVELEQLLIVRRALRAVGIDTQHLPVSTEIPA